MIFEADTLCDFRAECNFRAECDFWRSRVQLWTKQRATLDQSLTSDRAECDFGLWKLVEGFGYLAEEAYGKTTVFVEQPLALPGSASNHTEQKKGSMIIHQEKSRCELSIRARATT